MPELGTLGSVRGALSNERPYRNPPYGGTIPAAELSLLVCEGWSYPAMARTDPSMKERGCSDITERLQLPLVESQVQIATRRGVTGIGSPFFVQTGRAIS